MFKLFTFSSDSAIWLVYIHTPPVLVHTHLQYSFIRTQSSSLLFTAREFNDTNGEIRSADYTDIAFAIFTNQTWETKIVLNEYVIKHIALTFKTAQRLFTQRDLPTVLQSGINSRSRFINWYRLGTVTVITVLTDFFRAHNRRNSTLLFRMINEVFRFDWYFRKLSR